MNIINTFTIEGFDVDILYRNGFLGYSFKIGDKAYGNKLKLKSKSIVDVTATTFLLIENALATHKEITNGNK